MTDWLLFLAGVAVGVLVLWTCSYIAYLYIAYKE